LCIEKLLPFECLALFCMIGTAVLPLGDGKAALSILAVL